MGYYYDSDLGMYYLNARYYDQNIRRFVNADLEYTTDSRWYVEVISGVLQGLGVV